MNSGCPLSERPRKGRRYSVWLFLRGLFATRKPPSILGGTLAMKRSCTDFEKNSTVTGGALPRPMKQREAAFCCQCLINAASSDALSALNFSRDVELFSILFRPEWPRRANRAIASCSEGSSFNLLHFPDGFSLYDEDNQPKKPEEPAAPSREVNFFPNVSLLSPISNLHLPQPRDLSLPRI